jgi:hypothetical protein
MLVKAKKKVFNSRGVSVEKLFFFAANQRSSLFGPAIRSDISIKSLKRKT